MKIQTFSALMILLILFSCTSSDQSGPEEAAPDKRKFPSKAYRYIESIPRSIIIEQTVYVPVYSDIYYTSGEKRFQLTATLSIRNSSLSDTMYVDQVDYFDSQGHLLVGYLIKPIQLNPLESLEFIVENKETRGGAGANFVVHWAARNAELLPVIQCVMISASGTQGISFLTEGVVISSMLH